MALLSIYPNELNPTSTQKPAHKEYISFINNFWNLEVIKMPFNRWMHKQAVAHPCNHILSSDKKKWALKPEKDTEEIWIHIAIEVREASLKRLQAIWF